MQRIFIGIPLDQRSQQLINKLLEHVIESSIDIHWVPENNRHLTLAFMGDRSESEVDDLLRGFDEAYQNRSRFQYRLPELTRFPDPAGRIIALTGQPAVPLEDLYRTTQILLDENRIEFDQKAFRSHVTLGYIRKAGQVKYVFEQQTDITLDITEVVLYQSSPTETGSVYTRLKETKLGE